MTDNAIEDYSTELIRDEEKAYKFWFEDSVVLVPEAVADINVTFFEMGNEVLKHVPMVEPRDIPVVGVVFGKIFVISGKKLKITYEKILIHSNISKL